MLVSPFAHGVIFDPPSDIPR